MPDVDFWEAPQQVDRFANREPDRRLVDLLNAYREPARVRVLDLGCAGGRNTVLLAGRGFDVLAMDSAEAMVEHTRSRLAPIVGAGEADRRVRRGRMEDLSDLPDGGFDLVVALGLYHNANSQATWDAALSETARVLARNGLLLVANFTPDTDPTGNGVRPVPGQLHLFDGFPSGRVYLLRAHDLDAAMATHGLLSVVPSETVAVDTERGRRVTVNALYRKV